MALKGKYASDKEKEKWMSVMTPEVMSSAESAEDDGEEVILVHQLPWLTKEVAAFKQQMDDEIKKKQSPQKHTVRQSVYRVIGSYFNKTTTHR